MSIGFLARNANGELLVSDFAETYYYRGHYKVAVETTIPGYANVSATANSMHMYYELAGTYDLPSVAAGIYIPKFSDRDIIFLEPHSAAFAPISISTAEDGRWLVQIQVKPPLSVFNSLYPAVNVDWAQLWSYLPTVHLFVPWTGGQFPAVGHGAAFYNAAGDVTFISSGKPLRLKDLISVDMPQAPTSYGFNLNPTNVNGNAHAYCQRPMYVMPSLAQAVQEYNASGSNTSEGMFGLVSSTASWNYNFWAIYGGGLKPIAGNEVGTQWVTEGGGMWGNVSTSGDILFGLVNIDSGSSNQGYPPFRYNNVNYTGLPVLVADAADYA